MRAADTERPALLEAHVSVPDPDSAQRIAKHLVEQRLAACVQVLGPMVSVYTWQGEVHQAQEWLLLVKTTDDSFPEVTQVVADQHRYDVPEVIAVPVTHALSEYASWVRSGSGGSDDGEPSGD